MAENDKPKKDDQAGRPEEKNELTPREVEEIIRTTGKIPEGWYIPGITLPPDMLNPQKIGGEHNLPPIKTPQQIVEEAVERLRKPLEGGQPQEDPERKRRTFGPLGKGPFPHVETPLEKRLREQREREERERNNPPKPPTNGGPTNGK